MPKLKITDKNWKDRLSFCELLTEWNGDDFFHLAPKEEVFVYADRRPNYLNDRIWARSVKDINDEVRFREKSKHSIFIGICICLTAKALM